MSSLLTVSIPLTVLIVSRVTSSNSTILNQLEAGSIMVSAMKSIAAPSLPLRVHGPTRSTHSASHGVLITILDGRWPYFSVRLLLTWHDLHDFIMDWMHSFSIYHSVHCLLKTSVPRVLEIVVVPHRCSLLQRLGYDQPSFVTDAFLILDNLKF